MPYTAPSRAWEVPRQGSVGDATGRKTSLLLSALGQDGIGMAGNEGRSPGAEKATGLLTEWGKAAILALQQLTGDAVILTTKVIPPKDHIAPALKCKDLPGGKSAQKALILPP